MTRDLDQINLLATALNRSEARLLELAQLTTTHPDVSAEVLATDSDQSPLRTLISTAQSLESTLDSLTQLINERLPPPTPPIR